MRADDNLIRSIQHKIVTNFYARKASWRTLYIDFEN